MHFVYLHVYVYVQVFIINCVSMCDQIEDLHRPEVLHHVLSYLNHFVLTILFVFILPVRSLLLITTEEVIIPPSRPSSGGKCSVPLYYSVFDFVFVFDLSNVFIIHVIETKVLIKYI